MPPVTSSGQHGSNNIGITCSYVAAAILAGAESSRRVSIQGVLSPPRSKFSYLRTVHHVLRSTYGWWLWHGLTSRAGPVRTLPKLPTFVPSPQLPYLLSQRRTNRMDGTIMDRSNNTSSPLPSYPCHSGAALCLPYLQYGTSVGA